MVGFIAQGLLIPFFGTAAGAACVLFLKNALRQSVSRVLSGFAAGVMTAASVWSLLLPAIERSAQLGRFAFLPAVAGFAAGVAFLLLSDKAIPRLENFTAKNCGDMRKAIFLAFAVVLHNIPEGMAVGAALSGCLNGDISRSAALALAFGIGVQNFPEGAIISMPLAACGIKKRRAFLHGVLSGIVEPAAGLITVILSGFLVPLLPLLLSFAAGAMILVAVRDLIPDCAADGKNRGVAAFVTGFLVMMTLDVALG